MVTDTNPYERLVRMLELRLTRQRAALKDTELQLDGARESSMNWNETQLQLLKGKEKKNG